MSNHTHTKLTACTSNTNAHKNSLSCGSAGCRIPDSPSRKQVHLLYSRIEMVPSKDYVGVSLFITDIRHVAPLVDHEGALEFNDHSAVLIHTRRLHAHDADIRTRLRFAFLENFASGVNRVAFEHRVGKPNFIPRQI